MKPEDNSKHFLAITRSKGKMYEYFVPENYHISITDDLSKLFILSIGILGDIAAAYSRNEEILDSITENLVFSARFFDSYLQSKLNTEIEPYLRLLGATSYYLCELPGNSAVLIKGINNRDLSLGCDGLENLLAWLLNGNFLEKPFVNSKKLASSLTEIYRLMSIFSTSGSDENDLFNECEKLRQKVYKNGTPRQLLLVDTFFSVVKKRYKNSTWYSLPLYSDITKDQWAHILTKTEFIKELWPAQHLLGKFGVYKGKSAVVQMPTSAGKTKSIELIIRSAFISERTSLAVVVAPYRALCHEIKDSLSLAFKNEDVAINELTDVMQFDFNFDDLSKNNKILITTPEKLFYILKHTPEIAQDIGLLILDEGHQFDNGIRGVTYELLLTSLQSLLPENSQKIIISAVIGNAVAINEWFNGINSSVISSDNLTPTFKSLGFTSWIDALGQIKYVSNTNINKDDFFVPRVITELPLEKKTIREKTRFFPSKDDTKTIALYLGLKLVPNGGVAIFCGTKKSVATFSKMAVDIFDRKLSLNAPSFFSEPEEINKFSKLYSRNFGNESIYTKAVQLGIFFHDNSTPHGIRLAVEHAMRLGKICFVICTSTLSQGVNLPIKYLIIDGFYQGSERIKNRDFHNLIGRVGRSGIHTEGSILFANPLIYDRKRAIKENWRWNQVNELIDPLKSEPCVSSLLSIFDPIYSDDKKCSYKMDIAKLVKFYIEDPKNVDTIPNLIVSKYSKYNFSEIGVKSQIDRKMGIISAIESFLMSNINIDDESSDATHLVKKTLAYFLADDSQKLQIQELFELLSQNILEHIENQDIKKIYGKTLYGLWDAKEIENWIKENLNKIMDPFNDSIDTLWPLLSKYIRNNMFNKSNKIESMKDLASDWIKGISFGELLEKLTSSSTKIKWGTKFHDYQIDDVVDICENGFAYDGSLLLGAIIEFIDNTELDDKKSIIKELKNFQKKLKYGLPSNESIILYEMGFADRVIAQDLSLILGHFETSFDASFTIMLESEKAKELVKCYPSYYYEVLNKYL